MTLSGKTITGIKNDLGKAFIEGLVDKVEYSKDKNRKILLYIINNKNDAWNYSLDKALSDADAFIEDDNYLYYFSMQDYLPTDQQGRQTVIDELKKSLLSFEFIW